MSNAKETREQFRSILERLQRELASERLADSRLNYQFTTKLDEAGACFVTIRLERGDRFIRNGDAK